MLKNTPVPEFSANCIHIDTLKEDWDKGIGYSTAAIEILSE